MKRPDCCWWFNKIDIWRCSEKNCHCHNQNDCWCGWIGEIILTITPSQSMTNANQHSLIVKNCLKSDFTIYTARCTNAAGETEEYQASLSEVPRNSSLVAHIVHLIHINWNHLYNFKTKFLNLLTNWKGNIFRKSRQFLLLIISGEQQSRDWWNRIFVSACQWLFHWCQVVQR